MPNPDYFIVNEFFNTYPYQAEPKGEDHWKTLEEFIHDGGGDCEDYAIAKYHALKGKYDVKILVGYKIHKTRSYGHAVVLLNRSIILDINYPYVYSYSHYLEEWSPDKTYDAIGVQDVIVSED